MLKKIVLSLMFFLLVLSLAAGATRPSLSIKNLFLGGTFFWYNFMVGAQIVPKIAQLTEREKEQDCFHAQFLGSAAAVSSLAVRQRRQA
jgi:hypothetical protein